MHKSVTIYGSGPSLRYANFTDRSHKWSVGSLYPLLLNRINLYFCMHEGQKVHHLSVLEDVGYIDLNKYPIDKICKKFNSEYFTNSISYMIAYALYKKYKEITLVGVDVSSGGEYAFERPSIAYWCGVAASRGVKINWDKTNPFFKYGYDGGKMRDLIEFLNKQKETGKAELNASKDMDTKNQWLGFIYAIDQILNEVRG